MYTSIVKVNKSELTWIGFERLPLNVECWFYNSVHRVVVITDLSLVNSALTI